MKAYHLTIIALITITSISAQDIIILRTGEEKEAVVKKVGVTNIENVRYENQQGAVYEVLKDDVFMIKYHNGTKDISDTILV